jgi:redox-sensing transcriptional repressor
MAKNENISISVIRRLPRYYRFLSELIQQGTDHISSRELSKIMGLTASQIRQDLNCFGGFGQQGYGYHVESLFQEISRILGLDQPLKAILIGTGNLGRAIALHMEFETKGFTLIGLFDRNPEIIGKKIGGMQIYDTEELDEFCQKQHPHAAVLCIPKESAEILAERLIGLGVKAFWNFSHYDLAIGHEDIIVENVHMGDSLMTLSYRVHDVIEKE